MPPTDQTGDEFRDKTAALLRTKYNDVQPEVQLTAKKADIRFTLRIGPRRVMTVAAECKNWARTLTRDDVRDIVGDYTPAFNKKEINELWIICDRTPAPGARDYVGGYDWCQLMTGLECEQAVVDFVPMLTYLVNDFRQDNISKYFIPPSFDVSETEKRDLHSFVTDWLTDDHTKPVAIWAGYGMGKTSYARF